ncbi:MAG: tRNA pseudouridine(38-40) synthase TruA, partial [Planctomycetota bacterium]|nr:tRNA pseudouridine(38-40) synthase TruA [Planctomycetota bacterium]
MKVSPRTIALLVTYHGANFKGYARQPQRRTVQALLEESWFQVSGERVTMLASGRTDSGVHALGQVVHFETATDFEIEKVARALNSNFDSDCVVRQAVVQSSEFHASESAQLKHYIYQIALGSTPPVLGNEFCYWVPQRLDLSAMRTAMQSFIGTHDYESFAASGRTTSTTVRTVTNIHIQIKRDRLLIHVRGTGFLYKMVRNMVGSLLEI